MRSGRIPHRLLPTSLRQKAVQTDRVRKILRPGKFVSQLRQSNHPSHREWFEILDSADAVIATGGGYFTDSFEQHALGILINLASAQSMSTPTACFGQGIGPIHSKALKECVGTVLSKCNTLLLREDFQSSKSLKELGISSDQFSLTGDDALELIPDTQTTSSASTDKICIGLTIRCADYSGVRSDRIAFLKNELEDLSDEYSCSFCPLPIDLLDPESNDMTHALQMLENLPITDDFAKPESPEDVIRTAGVCSVNITGSYHSALFAIAQGVPVVAVQSNDYYAGKFGGLESLFPNSIHRYNPNTAGDGILKELISAALETPENIRESWISISSKLREKGREGYHKFFDALPTRKIEA